MGVTQQIQQLKTQIRELRKEMRAKGIKRISCFNGGLHGEVYTYNARMFALETQLRTMKEAVENAKADARLAGLPEPNL
jgi:hypothetical protein